MDDSVMGGLFPMPAQLSGVDYLQASSNHARLWKQRRLRLEAEAREAELAAKEQVTSEEATAPSAKPRTVQVTEERKPSREPEASL